MARDSGAGAYSNLGISVQGEVVGTRVAAGRHLRALHEQVVQQAGGADAEPARIQPVLPRRLVDQDQVADGVLGGADAASRLDADLAAVRLAEEAAPPAEPEKAAPPAEPEKAAPPAEPEKAAESQAARTAAVSSKTS